MDWLRRNLHWVLLVAFVLTGAGTVGLGAVGLMAAVLAAVTSAGLLAPFLEALIPFVLPVAVLAGLTVTFLLGTVATATSKAVSKTRTVLSELSLRRPSLPRPSWPRSDRLVGWAREAEYRVPPLARFRLPEKFEPTPEQRRQNLKEQYVNGEVDEFEFERRMADIVDGDDAGSRSTAGTVDAVDGDDERERDPGGTNIAVE